MTIFNNSDNFYKPVVAYVNIIRWPSAIPAGPFTARFMTGIANTGIETHVIVQSAAQKFDGQNGDGLAVLQNEYRIKPPQNLHFHVIKMPFWKPASDRVVFLERAGWLLGKLHRKYGINIVMSRDTRVLPYLARWSRKGLKTIYDTHNFYMDLSRRDDLKGDRWERYSKLENRYLPKLDGLITLLQTQKNHYAQFINPNKILTAHPGLDEARTPNTQRPDQKIILYLGSLQLMKGVDLLIDAFHQANLTGWKLLFVGGRSRKEIGPLQKKIEALGLEKRTIITGWLNDEQMRENINKASIAILPLKDAFYNRYLTAPSKLFDYLGHAIPIITSDLPAIRELAQNGALYIKPGNIDSLIQTIKQLANDDQKQIEMAQKAHERAKSLLWIERGKKTKAFLEQILNG